MALSLVRSHMGTETFLRQAYRLYAVTLVIWAVWSGIWLGTGITMPADILAMGWLGVAVFGVVVLIALSAGRVRDEYALFKTQSNRERIRRFNNHKFGGTFLNLYVVALAAWSFLSIEWVVLNLGLVTYTIVGYGWALIALYGVSLTIGLTVKHKEAVVEEVDNVTPRAITIED